VAGERGSGGWLVLGLNFNKLIVSFFLLRQPPDSVDAVRKLPFHALKKDVIWRCQS
jgi:hypothetical protein